MVKMVTNHNSDQIKNFNYYDNQKWQQLFSKKKTIDNLSAITPTKFVPKTATHFQVNQTRIFLQNGCKTCSENGDNLRSTTFHISLLCVLALF